MYKCDIESKLFFGHYCVAVSRSGELLMGWLYPPKLHIYSANNEYLTAVEIRDDEILCDVAWTLTGNIVYATSKKYRKSGKIWTITRTGRNIAQSELSGIVRTFTVSADKVIYCTCNDGAVYQSTDNGMKWNFVFKQNKQNTDKENRIKHRMIKVSSDLNIDVFWTLLYRTSFCVNVLNKRTNTHQSRKLHLCPSVKNFEPNDLTFDGSANIFVTDTANKHAIHVFSPSEQFLCTFDISKHLPPNEISYQIRCVLVNSQHNLLYVMLSRLDLPSGDRPADIVKVFTLIYG